MKYFLVLFIISIGILFSTTNSAGDFDISKLSSFEKLKIYGDLRTSPTTSVILASTLGFGTGLFIQSDVSSGVLCLCGELVGLGLAGGGLGSGYAFSSSGAGATVLVIGGGLLFVVSRIIQIILPISNSKKNNKLLLDKLGITVNF